MAWPQPVPPGFHLPDAHIERSKASMADTTETTVDLGNHSRDKQHFLTGSDSWAVSLGPRRQETQLALSPCRGHQTQQLSLHRAMRYRSSSLIASSSASISLRRLNPCPTPPFHQPQPNAIPSASMLTNCFFNSNSIFRVCYRQDSERQHAMDPNCYALLRR